MLRELIKRQSSGVGNSHSFKEYLLVVMPDTLVSDKVMAEKQNLLRDYGIAAQAYAKPHITVADFQAREEMEETLIRWIQRICSLHKSFRVTLNNYSGFPPHSIYLRVQEPEPFLQLAAHLKAIDDFIAAPAMLNTKPHLRIAGKLPERVYEKAMFDYSKKIFHESFTVGELILLKKDRQSFTCKTLNIFHFMPVLNEPGSETA